MLNIQWSYKCDRQLLNDFFSFFSLLFQFCFNPYSYIIICCRLSLFLCCTLTKRIVIELLCNPYSLCCYVIVWKLIISREHMAYNKTTLLKHVHSIILHKITFCTHTHSHTHTYLRKGRETEIILSFFR